MRKLITTPLPPVQAEVEEHGLPRLAWRSKEIEGDVPSANLMAHQVYLREASSGGIDAHYAWTLRGGRGKRVCIIDVEFGWEVEHEDLRSRVGTLKVPRLLHGTPGIGVCSADGDNGVGIIGIAHQARLELQPVRQFGQFKVQYSEVASAIRRVVAATGREPGHVILLELEANFSPKQFEQLSAWTESLPVEFSPDIRGAIEETEAAGVYVIQPAGNGRLNLDEFGFERKSSSPAIMVGAGHPMTHDCLPISNYGERVDVQGWGEGVVTTGRTDDVNGSTLQSHADPNRCYTQSFRGTSSASAIVAGAVACLSGILKANDVTPLPPREMRQLLIDTGTPQGGDRSKQIGPLPNLRAAIDDLERRFGPFKRGDDKLG